MKKNAKQQTHKATFWLFPHFAILHPLLLVWDGSSREMRLCSTPRLCFLRFAGVPLGQVHLHFLSLLGMETHTVRLPTSPCFSFPLPLCSLALSWACRQWFWQAVWCHLPYLSCFCKILPSRLQGLLPPVSGSALDSHPLPHHVPRLSPCPVGCEPALARGRDAATGLGKTDSVGRNPGPCPKECCPAAATASPGETWRDCLGSPLHLRQINWS